MAVKKAKSGLVFVGTSGYIYDHWQGAFYPETLPKKERFNYYSGQFSTLELNATFYHLFPEKTFEKWAAQAPPGFLYTVKMWRWITHRKRLNDIEPDLKVFLERVALLKKHLGPILIQLPPGLHRDDERLCNFLRTCRRIEKELKECFRFTVEFRHKSWFEPDIYQILEKHHIALCLPDMPALFGIRELTTDFIYIRFHGRPHLYQSIYSIETLQDWTDWIKPLLDKGIDVYAYFNNDGNANSVKNAKQLWQLIFPPKK